MSNRALRAGEYVVKNIAADKTGDKDFRRREINGQIVHMILRGDIEEALDILSKIYGVEKPRVKVGLPKGKSRVLGVYVPSKKTIYLKSREQYYNPLVILHEFYHHLRVFGGKHRGSEENANKFALKFLEDYRSMLLRRRR